MFTKLRTFSTETDRNPAADPGSPAALGTAAALGNPVAGGDPADRLPAADHTASYLHKGERERNKLTTRFTYRIRFSIPFVLCDHQMALSLVGTG